MSLHGEVQNNSTYKATYNSILKNQYAQSANEYLSREVFSSSGFTNGESIFYLNGSTPYLNTIPVNATESYTITEIPLYAVKSMKVNLVSASNSSGATGDYGQISFLDATPNQYATSSSSQITKTSAQIKDTPYLTKLKLQSKIHDPKKTRLVYTPKIRSNRFGNVLNNSNDIQVRSDLNISPSSLIKLFTLPNGATPVYVHIENVIENSYDIDHSASPYGGYGGISINKIDNKKHLIPSSDNIRFNFITPNFSTPDQHDHYIDTVDGSTVRYKFIEVKFPYKSTPDSLSISSTPSSYYPFNYKSSEPFTADSIDEIYFSLSKDGIENSQYGPATSYYYERTLNNFHGYNIGSFDFRRSDFGLAEYASSPNLYFTGLDILNENEDVSIFTSLDNPDDYATQYDSTSDEYGFKQKQLNHYDESINQLILKGVKFNVFENLKKDRLILPSIESGFLYQNGTPFYMYADEFCYPVTEINSDGSFILPSVVRQGAPVIVKANHNSAPIHFRQVSFANAATPTEYSAYNTEYVKAIYDNYLALAYENIEDVSVTDTYINSELSDGPLVEYQSSNIIQTPSILGVPQIKAGRVYKVTYRLRNSYFVDNQYYNELDKSYRTKITMITSTPSYNQIVNQGSLEVCYETSIFDTDTTFDDMSLNPLYSPIGESYLYLSQNEYPLSYLETYISPKEILDNKDQFISLNLFSKDVNDNPKPYISYRVSGDDISATPTTATTNSDGYARVYIKYTGDTVPIPKANEIFVSQTTNMEPGWVETSATISYYIKPTIKIKQKLSAEVTKKIINANNEETVGIFGSATPNALVYWRRGRNLYEAFDQPYSKSFATPGQNGLSGMVRANESGDFAIGPYRAQADATPGYWFVAVDTEMASSTPASTPSSIAGDIVYWYERYDVNQSSSSEPVLGAYEGQYNLYSHYLTSSSFKKNFETENVYYTGALENSWHLPKWYPLSRYTQYQMGLLGSTPYVIDTYEHLHPDYEEE